MLHESFLFSLEISSEFPVWSRVYNSISKWLLTVFLPLSSVLFWIVCHSERIFGFKCLVLKAAFAFCDNIKSGERISNFSSLITAYYSSIRAAHTCSRRTIASNWSNMNFSLFFSVSKACSTNDLRCSSRGKKWFSLHLQFSEKFILPDIDTMAFNDTFELFSSG